MSWFIPLGAAALVGGLALLVTGIRKHKAQHPKHVAMLIGHPTTPRHRRATTSCAALSHPRHAGCQVLYEYSAGLQEA